jgi:hypothetical protein
MTMNRLAAFTAATALGLSVSAGCQWHKQTAGEMVLAPDGQQRHQQPAPADAPQTQPAIPPTSPAVVIGAGPATRSATQVSALITGLGNDGRPLFVAADADEAARLRNWPLSQNWYASGNFIAGPTYRINAPPPRSNSTSDVVVEDLFQSVIVVGQMFATPVWAVFTPPLTKVEYHGEVAPPSYTVDDVLPYYPPNEKVPGIVNMRR